MKKSNVQNLKQGQFQVIPVHQTKAMKGGSGGVNNPPPAKSDVK